MIKAEDTDVRRRVIRQMLNARMREDGAETVPRVRAFPQSAREQVKANAT